VTTKKNTEENNDGVLGETKKKKSTKFSKPNINVDFDLFSQLPDLNLDYNSAPSTSVTLNATNSKKNIDDSKKQKKATSKAKKSENTSRNPNEIQLKLFQDCNFLNVTRKTLTRTNTGTLVISKPPTIKNLTKFLSKKESISLESLAKVNLGELIELWQNDEDDFITIGADDESATSDKHSTSLNETILLKEKFENYYSKLIEGLSMSEEEEEEDSDYSQIIETSVKIGSKKNNYEIPISELKELFMEEDDETGELQSKIVVNTKNDNKPLLVPDTIDLTDSDLGLCSSVDQNLKEVKSSRLIIDTKNGLNTKNEDLNELDELFKDEDDVKVEYQSKNVVNTQNDLSQLNKISKLDELFCDDDDEDDEQLLNFAENFAACAKNDNKLLFVPDTMDNNLGLCNVVDKIFQEAKSSRLLTDKTNGPHTIKEVTSIQGSNCKLTKNNFESNEMPCSKVLDDNQANFKNQVIFLSIYQKNSFITRCALFIDPNNFLKYRKTPYFIGCS
jgi:phage anti-repressor protein